MILKNEYGEVMAQARGDDSLRPGVVAMTHGWGNQKTPGLTVANRYPGVNINALLSNDLSPPRSKLSGFSSILVSRHIRE